MLPLTLMALNHCPNPECPFLKKFGKPAEYREGFTTCSDCGGALTADPLPAMPAGAAMAAAAPVAAVPRVEPIPADLLRRGVVSLAVLMAAALCEQVPLPGLSRSVMEFARADPSAAASVTTAFSLALHPFLSAFVSVELAALLVPGWNRLRTGPAGRSPAHGLRGGGRGPRPHPERGSGPLVRERRCPGWAVHRLG